MGLPNVLRKALRIILPKSIEYKTGLTKPPMKFPVGEGLSPKLAQQAQETITKTPEVPIGKKPTLTSRQAFNIISKYGTQQITEKRGEVPKTNISSELAQEAVETQVLAIGGATSGIRAVTGIYGRNVAQNVLNKYSDRISKSVDAVKKPLTQRISNTFESVYTATVDRFNPIANLVKKSKTEIPSGQNPVMQAKKYLGVKGVAEQNLFWKTSTTLKNGNLKVTGGGLRDILNPVKKNLDDLEILLVAERDLELARRGTIKGTFARESQEAIEALKVKYGGGFNVLSNAAKGSRSWANKALLEPLVDAGVLSEKQALNIRAANKFYTPFNRVMEEMEIKASGGARLFSPSGKAVQSIKGSEKQIVSPLENLITNNYRVTDLVEKVKVANSIVNLKNLSDDFADLITQVTPKNPSGYTPGKNIIVSFKNGVKQYHRVPEDVAKLVNSISVSEMGMLQKCLGFPARVLRGGATLSLEFIGRNPVRDQFSAMVFSKYGYVPGVDLIRGMFSVIGRTGTYQKWVASGGAQSMLVSLDRLSVQKKLQDVAGTVPLRTKAFRIVKNPLEALRIVSELMEKGTRVGEFGKGLSKGATEKEAALASREVTLDFARMGANTRFLNQIIAFFNANIQGVDKLARSFKEAPMRTSFKAVGGITIPSIGLYLLNRDNPRYQELPQYRKDLFWNIILPDTPIISIPKPFELGIVFGTVPERILQWIDKNDKEALEGIIPAVMRGATPGYIPTILTPYLENKTNYSFFRDRPIVSQSLQGLPEEFQANTYTSETAKQIGLLLKKSPAKIENYVLGYSAGLGRYALETMDVILKKTGIVNPPPAPTGTLADVPGMRAFIAREPIGSGSESVNKFYDLLDEARRAKAGAEFLYKKNKLDEAVEYFKKHPEIDYAKGLEKMASDLSVMRTVIEEIRLSRDISPEAKKEKIDMIYRLMTESTKQLLELIKSSQE